MDPPNGLRAPQPETLQVGPARTPLLDRLAPARRRRALAVMAFVLGVITGGGAVWWWNDRPPEQRPSPSSAATENRVRLVLGAVAAPSRSNEESGTIGARALWIDGALLHSRGAGTATVTRIHRPGGSLVIGVPELPVRVSANHSFERIRLRIAPGDCVLATRWTPSALPFTLTWQDDQGHLHTDVGGDHDASMELSLIRHMDAVCGNPPT